jgi:hypothetical protein
MCEAIGLHAYGLGQSAQDAALLVTTPDKATAEERRTLDIVRQRTLRAIRDTRAALPALRRDLRDLDARLSSAVDAATFDHDAPVEPPPERSCAHCGGLFPMLRSDARYCSTRCRVAAKRLRDRS